MLSYICAVWYVKYFLKRGFTMVRYSYNQNEMSKEVFILNRWRRIYGMVYGNAGSCYVIIENEIVFIEQYNLA